VTFKLAETSLAKSRPSVPHRANLFTHCFIACICIRWSGVRSGSFVVEWRQCRRHGAC